MDGKAIQIVFSVVSIVLLTVFLVLFHQKTKMDKCNLKYYQCNPPEILNASNLESINFDCPKGYEEIMQLEPDDDSTFNKYKNASIAFMSITGVILIGIIIYWVINASKLSKATSNDQVRHTTALTIIFIVGLATLIPAALFLDPRIYIPGVPRIYTKKLSTPPAPPSAENAADNAAQKAADNAAQKAAQKAAENAAQKAAQNAAQKAAQNAAQKAAQNAAQKAAENAAQKATPVAPAAADTPASETTDEGTSSKSSFVDTKLNGYRIYASFVTSFIGFIVILLGIIFYLKQKSVGGPSIGFGKKGIKSIAFGVIAIILLLFIIWTIVIFTSQKQNLLENKLTYAIYNSSSDYLGGLLPVMAFINLLIMVNAFQDSEIPLAITQLLSAILIIISVALYWTYKKQCDNNKITCSPETQKILGQRREKLICQINSDMTIKSDNIYAITIAFPIVMTLSQIVGIILISTS